MWKEVDGVQLKAQLPIIMGMHSRVINIRIFIRLNSREREDSPWRNWHIWMKTKDILGLVFSAVK